MDIIRNLSVVSNSIDMNVNKFSYYKPKLIISSKSQNLQKIQELYKLGWKIYGENYVKEALTKIPVLPKDIEWHYIGRIQSNKISLIVKHFDFLHTLSSSDHADKINVYCLKYNKHINTLIQLNIDQDNRKSGILINNKKEIENLVLHCLNNCNKINLIGFMCITSSTSSLIQRYSDFCSLHDLKNFMRNKYTNNINELSMGMSNDFVPAIQAGSTMVRIGKAIFSTSENFL